MENIQYIKSEVIIMIQNIIKEHPYYIMGGPKLANGKCPELSKEKIIAIRINKDKLSMRKLAKIYGISQMSIWRIIHHK